MRYLHALVAVLFLPSVLMAQSQMDHLQVRAVNYKTETTKGRLDLFTEIPYTRLTFEGSPDGFVARYQVKTELSELDPDGRPRNIVASPIWDKTVTVAIYANTVAQELSDLSTYSVRLNPGSYLISVTLTDLTSSATYFQEITARHRDFTQATTLSDVVLLAGYDPERQSILPYVSTDVDARDLQIYYEIYTQQAQTLLVSQTLKPQSGTPALRFPLSWTDTLRIDTGRHQQIAQIPASNLEFGRYDLTVTLKTLSGDLLDESRYPVSIRWNSLNTYLNNLGQAIEQLAYIARGDELRALRNAPSDSERKKRFEAFWQKRDPTPETVRNEALEEHYYRIDYSNRNFGQQLPGWQSDRGQVFVLHGHPDDIERQTFSYNNKPWEVWYFFRVGRQFMFIDQTGFGDFELVLPVWDDRTRLD